MNEHYQYEHVESLHFIFLSGSKYVAFWMINGRFNPTLKVLNSVVCGYILIQIKTTVKKNCEKN